MSSGRFSAWDSMRPTIFGTSRSKITAINASINHPNRRDRGLTDQHPPATSLRGGLGSDTGATKRNYWETNVRFAKLGFESAFLRIGATVDEKLIKAAPTSLVDAAELLIPRTSVECGDRHTR